MPPCFPGGDVSCVATASAKTSPARYVPAWQHPYGRDEEAAEALVKLVTSTYENAEVADLQLDGPRKHVALFVPYANIPDDGETMQFLFLGNGQVAVRSESWVRGVPDPPGCRKRGCINGSRTRGRLARLQQELGWLGGETAETTDQTWVPLLLH